MLGRKFVPKSPNSVFVAADACVVKKHDRSGRKRTLPILKIVFDSLVGVCSINMQEIDAAILDHLTSFIEGHLQKCREAPETRIMVCLQVFKHTHLRIHVNIALPCVHSKSLRVELQRSDRLTERAV